MVTKNDLSAKSGLGADVPLTSIRNLFICEENINPIVLSNILNENGYLAKFILKIEKSLNRVDNTKALKVIYPKITGKLMQSLVSDHNIRNRVAIFIMDLMSEIRADLFLIQMELLDPEVEVLLRLKDVQYVPVLNIHNYDALQSNIPNLISASPENIPMIGFTYASYRNANL